MSSLIKIFKLFIFLSVGLSLSCSHLKQSEGATMSGPLARAKELTQPKVKEYLDLLKELRHIPDFPSPPALQLLIARLKPFRLSLDLACEVEADAIVFYWFASDTALNTSVNEATTTILDTLTELGFKPDARGVAQFPELDQGYVKDNPEGIAEELYFNLPRHFIGTKAERCGLAFLYRIRFSQADNFLTLKSTLKAFPIFRCEALNLEWETLLDSEPYWRLSCGGTWEQYYTWNYYYRFRTQDALDQFAERILQQLNREGFKAEDPSSENKTLRKSHSLEPIFYLEKRNADYVLMLSIQPRT